MFSSPEEEVSTKRSYITPERYRNDEEDVFDAGDEEEIRPKKKCRKEKPQILVQAPPLPELPPFNFPISSEYQTTSASTSQYQTTPRHPGRPHSPARSSTSRLSPDRNNASSSIFQLNMKVQNILENQGEIMRMLRRLAAQSVGPEAVDVQDLIEKPFETLEQLKAFCERLDTDLLLRKQLVKAYCSWWAEFGRHGEDNAEENCHKQSPGAAWPPWKDRKSGV
ncbi:uncharacterized protein LOC133664798 [Entelurus aequoreus]|uniref:uncharacterized protein LOC133645310 n=1 Tax=Entelurus aequoreus TaxID=161455 RepID=UPI002B1D2D42|nr:uncharacterized protein LOC133645310 [Entelurus aequoreus]XP_061925702.1 uncharacterized protein LOC133664798 [Entelurus aequoreus]